MARKEPFTPIWNYDDSEEKKDRKKMTIRELDRERGKREAPPREEEEPKQFVGMFAEDRAAHHMTKKKERTIVVIVIGFPALIWSTHSGITDPRDPITLPYRVQQIVVAASCPRLRPFAIATFSIIALLVPIALIG